MCRDPRPLRVLGMVFGESMESIREWAKGNRINRKFLIGFKKRNLWFGHVWFIYINLQILGFLKFSKSTNCPFGTMHGAHCAMAAMARSELLQQPRLALVCSKHDSLVAPLDGVHADIC